MTAPTEDLIACFVRLFAEARPDISSDALWAFTMQLRQEFGGKVVYIKKAVANQKHASTKRG